MHLFFDTETTGLPKDWKAPVSKLSNWPRLVQIAWLSYDDSGNQISSREYIIQPQGFVIPSEAAKVHGISTEIAMEKGVPLKNALMEFSDAISEADVIIAHNMSFDEKIIGAEFLRENISSQLFQTTRLCTMEAATNYCKLPGNYGYKWPTLSELHSILFEEDYKDAHDALEDVKVCAKCFFRLKELEII